MAGNLHPTLLVVAGVSGTGKSTFGSELAKRLDVPFLDGDDLHPPSNIEKMKSGVPLDDSDREPWLHVIRAKAIEIVERPSSRKSPPPVIVIACSALKRKYRDLLRGPPEIDAGLSQAAVSNCQVDFIYLKGQPELIRQRLEDREDHFVGSSILASQLATLQEPDPDQENSNHSKTIVIPLSSDDHQPRSVVEMVNEALQELANSTRLPIVRSQIPIQLPTLQSLLDSESAQLKDVLALLFEVSDSIEHKLIPVLREEIQEKSPNSYSELIDHCQHIVENRFSCDEQVNFLASHPRIGELKGLSKFSSKEQGNQTDPAILARLEELNILYEQTYPGLRYVTFVNGRSRAEIVKEMEDLLTKEERPTTEVHLQDKEWQAELKRGIGDVFKIAQSRLKSMTEASSS
ncbi:uncharacterized protein PGTG_17060 [Puccinia graminis f. sp. tritici CRL 75-36-700-3]|uniref:gluconokinase n=1 Tax=Puccinia graminis f. sp. tritici (strain CRL 75-36-700-3 / race SCCL) TaxID=418459 RepID=E3L2R3_PUCGT|nr:uncharacterized protein PGTG_17060 [Puccinia graminis f. sp. tritici CRL 75-36-700-3]EFP90861.2 hypothetical protein PGTG_17060 [Puccinia graminis f. sp. tritici CRL 75-36-700-3]